MLNFTISVMFKLIILVMLIYILAYIIDWIIFEVYIYPKMMKKEEEEENIEIIDISVDDDLDKAVDDVIKKLKEMKDDE